MAALLLSWECFFRAPAARGVALIRCSSRRARTPPQAGYELGPGKVLSGIMKRVDKKAPAITNIEV